MSPIKKDPHSSFWIAISGDHDWLQIIGSRFRWLGDRRIDDEMDYIIHVHNHKHQHLYKSSIVWQRIKDFIYEKET